MAVFLPTSAMGLAVQVVLAILTITFLPPIYNLLRVLLTPASWASRTIPGPPYGHFLSGQMKELRKHAPFELQERWVKQYGKVMRYAVMPGAYRVYVHDAHAISHVLARPTDFIRPEPGNSTLNKILGPSLLSTKGEVHRKQKKIISPAFSPAKIRDLTPIFLDKSILLRDILLDKLTESKAERGVTLDIREWITKATIDIIGLAGLDFQFDALSGKETDFKGALGTLVGTFEFNKWRVIRMLLPIFEYLPAFDEHTRRSEENKKELRDIGMKLVTDKKKTILEASGKAGIDEASIEGIDLLSVLIRSNMTETGPTLADDEVLAQITAFIIAGHETSSTTVGWALWALCLAPEIQDKLRTELLAVPTSNPSMEELNALPYLDAVLRETLRVHATVPAVARMAVNDCSIPLSEPFMGKDGIEHDHIRLRAGEFFQIPILGMNTSEEIFGADAKVFRPERWLSGLPEQLTDMPGVWGNILSFLAGPHACVGYRFAVFEMKAILFTLIRSLRFEVPDPAPVIEKKLVLVTQPFVKGEKESRLPLVLKAVE